MKITKNEKNQQYQAQKKESIISILVGAVFIFVAVFADPIGSNPDSGVIELSATTLQWIFASAGILFIVVGLYPLTQQFFLKK